ncbi:MAG: DUF1428 domain-containing protein [Verrucomicrobiaceae bacterium]|nr:DUF1428 domain-containing protein [Verrucomicrobiaceae bacterium]
MKTPGQYVDGFLLPISPANLPAYREIAEMAATVWMEHGALQYTECAADDLSTQFCRGFDDTIGASAEETVVFAWAVFADRESRDAANAKIMADPRIQEMGAKNEPLFDFKRMAFGGFKVIVSH